MKILWFEISVPAAYNAAKNPTAGWQDALQAILKGNNEIELGIAFENRGNGEKKVIDGVSYFPINTTYNFWDRQRAKVGWQVAIDKTLDAAEKTVNEFKPDIIHVFGSEWCFGLLAERVKTPVVIHMQGSIPPYNNALMPPMYSVHDLIVGMGWKPKTQFNAWLGRKKDKSRQEMEERILRGVQYYMGRTAWDKCITQLYNPQSTYFYCSEALRQDFIKSATTWTPPRNKTFRIVTTGISSFWKGIDTVLRTAHKLKERGFDFEWILAGNMHPLHKRVIEKKEGLRYAENNVKIAGFLNSTQLHDLLMSSDLYVHTAYIDNSPNAICEAQCLGLPIVATYVGGIPSLIDNGKEGLLIPANDPFTLAYDIINLANDESRRVELGQASMKRARERHNPSNIMEDLINCYQSIIDKTQK